MFQIRASLWRKIIPKIKTRPNILKENLEQIRRMAKNRTYVTRQLDTTLPEVSNLLNTEVKWLCNLFLNKGYEIRVIGGAVRDMLMEKFPKDIDLSTTATPDQMIDLCKEKEIRYIETGLHHGTLTIHLNERDYEVTTLRIDVETFGRLAKVEFTQDWYLDAERRDLTVNAMSVDINGVLHDYFNGEEDLKNWKVSIIVNVCSWNLSSCSIVDEARLDELLILILKTRMSGIHIFIKVTKVIPCFVDCHGSKSILSYYSIIVTF